MPELPEVETVCRALRPALVGRRIAAVELHRADLRFPFPPDFVERLSGRRIADVTRRAKYILVHLDTGDLLIVHLGMTGRLMVGSARTARPAQTVLGDYVYDSGHLPQHDHVVVVLKDGTTLTYNDPRRFGYMLLVEASALGAHPLFRHLGVEPLSPGLDAEALAARAAGRRADLKAFLMDQRHIAGLGNIYVCEALFRAGLSPRRRAGTLAGRAGRASGRAERLVPAIRAVLEEAVMAGGSTLRDYRQPDGSSGAFQNRHDVYDREGEPCRRPGCDGRIRRIVQAGRSTFYCPKCQS